MAKYHIFTDGSSRRNPGKGGWGMVVMNEEENEVFFVESDTEDYVTNNRMELKAMMCALGYAESHPNDYFVIYSDSTYVVNSCNVWMRSWAANGWKNSKKQVVENVDLMKALYSYLSRDFFNAEIIHCKGHNGDIGNEIADAIATQNWSKLGQLYECWNIRDYDFENRQIMDIEAGENWFPND